MITLFQLGISTYGPGCSLPSRYLKILPYTQWIQDNMGQSRRAERKIQTTTLMNIKVENRRKLGDDTVASKEIAQDFYEDKDAIIMKYLANESTTMYIGKESIVILT